jgi:hypothetical protein
VIQLLPSHEIRTLVRISSPSLECRVRGLRRRAAPLRPVVGILLYIVGAALGWLFHPLLAVRVFAFVIGYYA